MRALEMPKSPSLTVPPVQQNTLVHFRSRWMMPCASRTLIAGPKQVEARATCTIATQDPGRVICRMPDGHISAGTHEGVHACKWELQATLML